LCLYAHAAAISPVASSTMLDGSATGDTETLTWKPNGGCGGVGSDEPKKFDSTPPPPVPVCV